MRKEWLINIIIFRGVYFSVCPPPGGGGCRYFIVQQGGKNNRYWLIGEKIKMIYKENRRYNREEVEKRGEKGKYSLQLGGKRVMGKI